VLLCACRICKVHKASIPLGGGRGGARAPVKFGKNIFGQLLCKIRAFFRAQIM